METYTIKELKWVKKTDCVQPCYELVTPFGTYEVANYRDEENPYIVAVFYNGNDCDGLIWRSDDLGNETNAKKHCFVIWKKMMKKHLTNIRKSLYSRFLK